jgi:hypothetical protein
MDLVDLSIVECNRIDGGLDHEGPAGPHYSSRRASLIAGVRHETP